MATPTVVTLDQLRQWTRARAGVQNSLFIQDDELNTIINQATSQVYDFLVNTFQQYFVAKANFTLTTSNEITLDSITGAGQAFRSELGLDYLNSSVPTSVPKLDSYQQRNNGAPGLLGMPNGIGPRAYDIVGSSLIIFPPNGNWAGSYTLHYVPEVPTLSDVVDLPTEMSRWVDLILLNGAIVIKEKRNQSTTQLEQRLAERTREVKAAARRRTLEPQIIPMRIRDGRGGFGGSGLF